MESAGQIRQMMIRKQRVWWATQCNDNGDAKMGIGHRYKIRLLIGVKHGVQGPALSTRLYLY